MSVATSIGADHKDLGMRQKGAANRPNIERRDGLGVGRTRT